MSVNPCEGLECSCSPLVEAIISALSGGSYCNWGCRYPGWGCRIHSLQLHKNPSEDAAGSWFKCRGAA